MMVCSQVPPNPVTALHLYWVDPISEAGQVTFNALQDGEHVIRILLAWAMFSRWWGMRLSARFTVTLARVC